MKKIINQTNGKKTTATAIAFVVLGLIRAKYPDFLAGYDDWINIGFTAIFSSTLFHKLWRTNIDKVKEKIDAWVAKRKNK